jgi:hypothetical protein
MRLLQFYLFVGLLICVWFSFATAKGWRAINTGFLDSSSSSGGRGYGGSWGGGK